MFANVGPQPLFPTFLWAHDLEAKVRDDLNKGLTETLKRITPDWSTLPPGRNLQTEQNLHERMEFQKLSEIALAAARNVCREHAYESDDVVLTALWANINPPGTEHPQHTHPNNLFSGIYYLSAPQGGNSVLFLDPRPQTAIISPRIKSHNRYNAVMAQVPAQAGRLYIFPAWFGHAVPPNQSRDFRISLSFNVMFRDFEKTVSRPVWDGQKVSG